MRHSISYMKSFCIYGGQGEYVMKLLLTLKFLFFDVATLLFAKDAKR